MGPWCGAAVWWLPPAFTISRASLPTLNSVCYCYLTGVDGVASAGGEFRLAFCQFITETARNYRHAAVNWLGLTSHCSLAIV